MQKDVHDAVKIRWVKETTVRIIERTKNEDDDPKRSLGQVSLPRRQPYSTSTREVLPTDVVDGIEASAKKILP